MKKYLIQNFKHIPGKNCITTALRNILNYYHILLSEELILGLAGGLGFYYAELEGFPNPFISGNSSGMVERFCRNLDLKLHELHKDDPEAAHKALVGKILSDLPVIIKIDLFYLDYFKSKYHFSGHRVIPAGIDDRHFYVADTGFRDLKSTSIENFKLGRKSGHGPFIAGNLQHYIEKPEHELPIMDNLWKIIAQNAREMIQPSDNCGLAAIERFIQNLTKFRDPEYLLTQIERTGSGGALGRHMYRDFLGEALLYRPHPALRETCNLYVEVVAIYKRIVEDLQRGEMAELGARLTKTRDLEHKAMALLATLD